MNNPWAFLPMRESNDLLGDPGALRTRIAEESYLYFRQVLDPDALTAVRHEMLRALARNDWVKGGYVLDRAVAICRPVHEGVDEFAVAYDDVQRGEAFHSLAHDPDLLAIMQQVVGPSAFPHPLKVARLAFPAHYEVSTPPHQDFPNNQGTPNLTASWIPLSDCSTDLGGLAILRGSHRWGVLPLDTHPGPGNRQASLPLDMLEQCRWVTTDYTLGDVLLFPSLAVHSALHNASEFNMRLSVDYRYQVEGEPLTDLVLHPHFQRLTWEQVYEGWASEEHQYYWRDLDYDVVPFEDMLEKPFETAPDANLTNLLAERAAEGKIDVSAEDWQEIMSVEAKRKARYERRMERLDQHLVDTAPNPGDGAQDK